MLQKKSNEKGFTLIEVIVTLILVGITAALAGMWIVSVANGYIFAKMNANTTQKGQLAMARLSKELSAIQSITLSSGTSIEFNRVDTVNTAGIPIKVTYDSGSNTLQLQRTINNIVTTGILTDSVSAFDLKYCDGTLPTPTCSSSWATTTNPRIIEVNLTLTGNTPSKFTTRVTPRNI